MRPLKLISLALCLPWPAFAQPDSVWTAFCGEGLYNDARDLEFDAAGDIYVIGSWNWTPQAGPDDPHLDGDLCLVKYSADGALLWDRQYGGPNGEEGHAICPAHDGGWILLGTAYSEGTTVSADVYVLHVDDGGGVIWEDLVGSPVEDKGRDVVPTPDGGYIGVGWTREGDFGLQDAFVFKLDAGGDILWEENFGGDQNDELWSISHLDNGNYITAGRTWSFGAGGRDALLVELDPDGNVLWMNTFGGDDKDHIYEIRPAADGGFFGAGKTESFDIDLGDTWLIKADSNGQEQWISLWGDEWLQFGRSCQPVSDGGCVVCGVTGHWGSPGNQIWVAKADTDGNWLWTCEFGGTGIDDSWSVRQAADGDFVIAGLSQSAGDAEQSQFVIRMDSTSSAVNDPPAPMTLPRDFRMTRIYPNPFNETTTVVMNLPSASRVQLGLTDILGRWAGTLASVELLPGTRRLPLNLRGYPSGVYFLTAVTQSGARDTQRIVLLR